jgi:hypothetical protein
MKRFIEGENRYQSTLFPESLEDYIAEDNAVRQVAVPSKLVRDVGCPFPENQIVYGLEPVSIQSCFQTGSRYRQRTVMIAMFLNNLEAFKHRFNLAFEIEFVYRWIFVFVLDCRLTIILATEIS